MSKFKIGDRVRCLNGSGGGFRRGEIYVVSSIYNDWLGIDLDRNGEKNGWAASNFELAVASPVRTETIERKVIVPGVYGPIQISMDRQPMGGERPVMSMDKISIWSVEDWRSVAATATAIAEALESNK